MKSSYSNYSPDFLLMNIAITHSESLVVWKCFTSTLFSFHIAHDTECVTEILWSNADPSKINLELVIQEMNKQLTLSKSVSLKSKSQNTPC